MESTAALHALFWKLQLSLRARLSLEPFVQFLNVI